MKSISEHSLKVVTTLHNSSLTVFLYGRHVTYLVIVSLTGSNQSELLSLQREKLRAMDVKDTRERLENSLKLVKDNISMIAAKLAIQSVEVH